MYKRQVLWEAIRRVPSNVAAYNQLALAWVERDGFAEAEALLRKASILDPNNGPVFVELARVLWLLDRADDALAMLRDFLGRADDDVAAAVPASAAAPRNTLRRVRPFLNMFASISSPPSSAVRLVRMTSLNQFATKLDQDQTPQPEPRHWQMAQCPM